MQILLQSLSLEGRYHVLAPFVLVTQVYAPQLRAIASALKVYGATTGAKIIFGEYTEGATCVVMLHCLQSIPRGSFVCAIYYNIVLILCVHACRPHERIPVRCSK